MEIEIIDNELNIEDIGYNNSGRISLSKECNTSEVNIHIKGNPVTLFFLLLGSCETVPAFRKTLLLVAEYLNSQTNR